MSEKANRPPAASQQSPCPEASSSRLTTFVLSGALQVAPRRSANSSKQASCTSKKPGAAGPRSDRARVRARLELRWPGGVAVIPATLIDAFVGEEGWGPATPAGKPERIDKPKLQSNDNRSLACSVPALNLALLGARHLPAFGSCGGSKKRLCTCAPPDAAGERLRGLETLRMLVTDWPRQARTSLSAIEIC